MLGKAEIVDASDEGQPRGMPRENLAALKAFVESKRQELPAAKPAKVTAFSALPDKVQAEIDTFISGLSRIKLLRPDGMPRREWKVHTSYTWDDAWLVAENHAAEVNAAWSLNPTLTPVQNQSWNAARDAFLRTAIDNGREGAAKELELLVSKKVQEDFAGKRRTLYFLEKEWLGLKDRTVGAFTESAQLEALMLLVDDFAFPQKGGYREFAARAWSVWLKGYALWGDLDGELQVYCQSRFPRLARVRSAFRDTYEELSSS